MGRSALEIVTKQIRQKLISCMGALCRHTHTHTHTHTHVHTHIIMLLHWGLPISFMCYKQVYMRDTVKGGWPSLDKFILGQSGWPGHLLDERLTSLTLSLSLSLYKLTHAHTPSMPDVLHISTMNPL